MPTLFILLVPFSRVLRAEAVIWVPLFHARITPVSGFVQFMVGRILATIASLAVLLGSAAVFIILAIQLTIHGTFLDC